MKEKEKETWEKARQRERYTERKKDMNKQTEMEGKKKTNTQRGRERWSNRNGERLRQTEME